jgi:uncharacterized protein Yka (UPF0111/DUF47 family)
MLRDLDEGKSVAVEKRYARIKNMKDNIEQSTINLMEYVIKVSPALMFKDVYVTVIQDLVRSAEHAEAAAFRILLLNNKEFKRMSDKIYVLVEETIKKLSGMIDILSSMITKLRENPKQIRELYFELIKSEDSIDEYYREGGIDILKEYSNDVGALMLLKELFDKLEDAADILKRVGTYIRYIALHR